MTSVALPHQGQAMVVVSYMTQETAEGRFVLLQAGLNSSVKTASRPAQRLAALQLFGNPTPLPWVPGIIYHPNPGVVDD